MPTTRIHDTLADMLHRLRLDHLAEALQLDYREEDGPGGLTVEKSPGHVRICYTRPVYLYRALGLLKEHEEEAAFTLTETARFSMNGVMLDCSRGAVPTVETVKDMLRQLALMGHSTVMLYTEDTYEIEGQPYFGYMRGRYSVAELQELDAYAASFGIALIPCIQTLGHLAQALRWEPYRSFTDTPDILLADDERTYAFIERMLQACRRAYTSERIHIGLDETHFLGRGTYYDLHGEVDKVELFLRHLKRVADLCETYGFRPMIWGDMPFRIAGYPQYTDADTPIDPARLSACIPDTVDVICWDYYSCTKERYAEFITAHQKLSTHVIFAGGAWRWANFAPNLTHSLAASRCALQACAEHGVREVFTTLWGDGGSEASIFACWPAVQLYAEYNFHDAVDEPDLARRFAACTGGCLADFRQLERLNRPCGRQDRKEDNPGKYLFYQDPLLGAFDYHVQAGFGRYYQDSARVLWECADRAGRYEMMFATLAALCDVLADKSELGVRLKTAYDAGDGAALRHLAAEVIPRTICSTQAFLCQLRRQWMAENKPFGFDTLDKRGGGVLQRLRSAAERIEDYLSGRIDRLEELEAPRLAYNGQEGRHTVYIYQGSRWEVI